MKREEILTYFAEGYRLLQEDVKTEELTDYAREQACFFVGRAMEYIRENEDIIF